MTIHLITDDGIKYLTPADELEEAELGERVGWWLTNEAFAVLYTYAEDRERSMALTLVGSVATATSHRGLMFPPAWYPVIR